MKLRKMTLEDISQVAEIEKQCFSLPWSRKEIEKTFLSDNVLFIVAEIKGIIVAYVGIIIVLEEANIINIATHINYRRLGIAKGLLETLLSEARKIGVNDITLEVRQSNSSAIDLYKSFGFESAGIRRNFYNQPPEDAIIMWKYDL